SRELERQPEWEQEREAQGPPLQVAEASAEHEGERETQADGDQQDPHLRLKVPCRPVANGALLYEVTDHIARVTINRPERRNAMSWDVITGLRQAAADAKADDDVRVLVLTGAGEQAFCAGADLTGMRGDAGFV